ARTAPAATRLTTRTTIHCGGPLCLHSGVSRGSLIVRTATPEIVAMTPRYTPTEPIQPVVPTRYWAMVGAKDPPKIAPMAYEMETPNSRVRDGNISEYIADCGP